MPRAACNIPAPRVTRNVFWMGTLTRAQKVGKAIFFFFSLWSVEYVKIISSTHLHDFVARAGAAHAGEHIAAIFCDLSTVRVSCQLQKCS
jgi:hypothetical protein